MNTVRLNAYAKLNLTLDVLGVAEGYHQIDSLVCTIDLFDRIVAKKRKDGLISVTMRGMGSESIPPEHNNAQKAGEAFVSAFSTQGADITVYKNIPIGAGLGGSSADAAGVLNALAKLYNITDEKALKKIADSLGSDTGYLLKGGFARMQGRGERVTPLSHCPKLYFLLICPKNGVSTAECYRLCDELSEKTPVCTQAVLNSLQKGDIQGGAALMQNALYPAAATLNEEVAKALEEAKSFSPWGACMTGSGSAVFALFETKELCEWAKSRYRGKFRVTCARLIEIEKEGKSKTFRNPFALEEGEGE